MARNSPMVSGGISFGCPLEGIPYIAERVARLTEKYCDLTMHEIALIENIELSIEPISYPFSTFVHFSEERGWHVELSDDIEEYDQRRNLLEILDQIHIKNELHPRFLPGG